MNFNQLDNRHKRALICHVQLFRIAIRRLSKDLSPLRETSLVDDLSSEVKDFVDFLGDEEVNEIVATIENSLDIAVP